jgi:diadenosine tetraphosphate (Ap4A) HIT family hydrolase
MPTLISKSEATERIQQERGDADCPLCALLSPSAAPRYLLREGHHCSALLPRYARQWGHAMIILRRHVTVYQELTADEWTEASLMALQAAQAIERALKPVRCYVASLGAASEHPMTFPHLHLHVIPTYQATDTPSQIFSTRDGVLVGRDDEWRALQQQILATW